MNDSELIDQLYDQMNEKPKGPGIGSKILGGIGDVLGAGQRFTGGLVRDYVSGATGTKMPETATPGGMLRAGLGFSQGDEGYGGALAGKAIETAENVATDPLTYAGMGLTGKVGKVAGLAFTGMAGVGAGESAWNAAKRYKQEGFTPKVAEDVFDTALQGSLAIAGTSHLIEGPLVASRIPTETPEVLQKRLGEYKAKGKTELADMVQGELDKRQVTADQADQTFQKQRQKTRAAYPRLSQDRIDAVLQRAMSGEITPEYADGLLNRSIRENANTAQEGPIGSPQAQEFTTKFEAALGGRPNPFAPEPLSSQLPPIEEGFARTQERPQPPLVDTLGQPPVVEPLRAGEVNAEENIPLTSLDVNTKGVTGVLPPVEDRMAQVQQDIKLAQTPEETLAALGRLEEKNTPPEATAAPPAPRLTLADVTPPQGETFANQRDTPGNRPQRGARPVQAAPETLPGGDTGGMVGPEGPVASGPGLPGSAPVPDLGPGSGAVTEQPAGNIPVKPIKPIKAKKTPKVPDKTDALPTHIDQYTGQPVAILGEVPEGQGLKGENVKIYNPATKDWSLTSWDKLKEIPKTPELLEEVPSQPEPTLGQKLAEEQGMRGYQPPSSKVKLTPEQHSEVTQVAQNAVDEANQAIAKTTAREQRPIVFGGFTEQPGILGYNNKGVIHINLDQIMRGGKDRPAPRTTQELHDVIAYVASHEGTHWEGNVHGTALLPQPRAIEAGTGKVLQATTTPTGRSIPKAIAESKNLTAITPEGEYLPEPTAKDFSFQTGNEAVEFNRERQPATEVSPDTMRALQQHGVKSRFEARQTQAEAARNNLEEPALMAEEVAPKKVKKVKKQVLERKARVKLTTSFAEAVKNKHFTQEQADSLMKAAEEEPGRVAKILEIAKSPTLMAKINEGWKMNLIFAPSTWVVKGATDLGEVGFRLGESAIAPLIDKILPGPRTRFSGEARAELIGQTGRLGQAAGKLGRDLKDAFLLSSEKINPDRPLEMQIGKIGGNVGKFWRTPGRILNSITDFFQTTGAAGELGKLAFRRASAELVGKSQDLIQTRTQEIMKEALDPTSKNHTDLLKQANLASHERVFQSREPGPLLSSLMRMRSNNPWIHAFVPFLEVPGNITKMIGQRSPLGFVRAAKAYRAFNDAVKAGKGPAEIALLKGKAVDAITRPMLGTVIFGTALAYAKAGGMTGGGPTDQKKKNALLQGGWQPYSFKVGNTYIPFHRFEPAGSLLGFAADAADITSSKDSNEVLDKALHSVAENYTNQSYMQSVADAMEFISDPKTALKTYATSMAGSVVPNIIRRGAQTIDPTVRDIKPRGSQIADIPDLMRRSIQAGIPGLSQMLPPKVSNTGEPITRPGIGVTRFVLPVQPSWENEDTPAMKHLLDIDYAPGVPSKSIKIQGKDVPLTEQEYEDVAGANRKALDYVKSNYFNNSRFMGLPPEKQKIYVERIFNAAREAAKARLEASATFHERARQLIHAS